MSAAQTLKFILEFGFPIYAATQTLVLIAWYELRKKPRDDDGGLEKLKEWTE